MQVGPAIGKNVPPAQSITGIRDKMSSNTLSIDAKKCLANHLGEQAGKEIANLFATMEARLSAVERDKVDVTSVVPGQNLLVDGRPRRLAKPR